MTLPPCVHETLFFLTAHLNRRPRRAALSEIDCQQQQIQQQGDVFDRGSSSSALCTSARHFNTTLITSFFARAADCIRSVIAFRQKGCFLDWSYCTAKKDPFVLRQIDCATLQCFFWGPCVFLRHLRRQRIRRELSSNATMFLQMSLVSVCGPPAALGLPFKRGVEPTMLTRAAASLESGKKWGGGNKKVLLS